MKNEKPIRVLKMDMIKRMESADGGYYGLSLENLLINE